MDNFNNYHPYLRNITVVGISSDLLPILVLVLRMKIFLIET